MKSLLSKFSTPLFLAVGLMAAGIGFYAAGQLGGDRSASLEGLEGATYLAGGRPVTPFELIDHHGEPFDNSRLQGQWSFVFFGFTYCPDICPMTLAVMDALEERVEAEGLNAELQGVFISVDPERDTPERLAQYVPYFNPGFIGVTGDEAELTQLSRDLGILFIRHEPEDDSGNYMVDHTSHVLLFDHRGELVALFRAPHQADSMYRDFKTIVRHHR